MAIEKTLCILKPDAVKAGNIGNIIAHIQKEGCTIQAMKLDHGPSLVKPYCATMA